jgi:hypothetical protein
MVSDENVSRVFERRRRRQYLLNEDYIPSNGAAIKTMTNQHSPIFQSDKPSLVMEHPRTPILRPTGESPLLR